MKLWIVTIGSSDVQLDSDKVSREKKRKAEQYSADVWGYWYTEKIQHDFCNEMLFEPKRVIDTLEETYRIPSRVLGTVYQKNSAEVQEEISELQKEIWSYLTFPLLSNFSQRLKSLGGLGAIAYLLTDQSAIFDSDEERRKPKSPYWDDTCKLQPILERYFQNEFTKEITLIPLKLSPAEKPGLDDWDKVLGLVKDELNKIQLDPKPDTVYVSHQAGTPAISSAVQFMSLARFRNKVTFIVSNEHSGEITTIDNSTYLGAIQRQEARALLEQHDYAAVKSLLNDLDSETQILLDAAIEWNYAKFGEFAEKLKELSDEKFVEQVNERSKHWWWTAYEAAYLGVIRHGQKNIVEALFHSFRSVEGLVCQWAEEKYKDYILYDKKGSPQMIEKIEDILPEYWEKIQEKNPAWIKQQNKENEDRLAKGKEKKPISVGLFSQNLYLLLEFVRPDCKQNSFLKKGLYSAKDERNQQFHRLLGLREDDLFKVWKADDVDSWKSILLGCLNFIAQPDLPEPFTSLEDASLMAQVHQKLEAAINPKTKA